MGWQRSARSASRPRLGCSSCGACSRVEGASELSASTGRAPTSADEAHRATRGSSTAARSRTFVGFAVDVFAEDQGAPFVATARAALADFDGAVQVPGAGAVAAELDGRVVVTDDLQAARKHASVVVDLPLRPGRRELLGHPAQRRPRPRLELVRLHQSRPSAARAVATNGAP